MPEPDLTALLRDIIRREGPLPFVQFMDTALYHPGAGYYEHATIGREGDFYTSASTGGLFGKLLAFQFAAWCEALPPGPVHLVEAGAHDGQLAADILGWMATNRPQLARSVCYTILENSPTRQSWQARRLEKFAGQVQWRTDISALAGDESLHERPRLDSMNYGAPISKSARCDRIEAHADSEIGAAILGPSIRGVIFSNELLDAFPVHRLGWNASARCWFEWGVGWRNERFVWERLGPVSDELVAEMEIAGLAMPAELLAVLPDGFTIELAPAARRWWKTAAAALDQGWLLTLDYGLMAEEFFHPRRADGTLRAYRRHHLSSDVLAQPGAQDLTAHINFTALLRTGEQAGLKTVGLISQTEFLTRIAEQTWALSSNFGEWSPAVVRQFQTLTHPDHFGRAFRVLIQRRAA